MDLCFYGFTFLGFGHEGVSGSQDTILSIKYRMCP